MITSWELIMAAHTSWHSSEAASGEKQSKEKNGTSRFLSLPMSEPPPRGGWYATKKPRIKSSEAIMLISRMFLSQQYLFQMLKC